MRTISELLRPIWGSEQWIQEGWEQISEEDKAIIERRVNELFKNGLPLTLKHDKIIYIYTFSLLAQLEVLAIQVPLKFKDKMSTDDFRKRMHQQLLDEIFHGIVFTKILYMLCAPYSLPPSYNENVELLCNFIRNENCPKVALMLLNLIGEGWIEEIFYSLKKHNVAPLVFDVIIDDEHRHVSEADLYRDIGLPDFNEIKTKLAYLEEQLLTNVFMQYQYMFSITTLLGLEGAIEFNHSLNAKHLQQLKKINLEPSEHWQLFMSLADEVYPKLNSYGKNIEPVEMTHLRRLFMTQWDEPGDPTMVGDFSIDVSCIEFFNRKFPSETITTLIMQAVSYTLAEAPHFRIFLSQNKLYQNAGAYVGLVVKLPECNDHLGTIVFDQCHLLSTQNLALKIRNIIKMMVYCYKKREFVEKNNPSLLQILDSFIYEVKNSVYDYPLPGSSIVSVSNIGFCGYSGGKSPLRKNESIKFTLMEVERKPIWDNEKNSFMPRDMLPVSISADHRVFDGNFPVPKLIAKNFNKAFTKMIEEIDQQLVNDNLSYEVQFIKFLDQLLLTNVELGYKTLLFLQTYWLEFMSLEEILASGILERATNLASETMEGMV